jgi:DNA helicase-2/ATP-dependent DNA helicase PcrA
MKYDSSLLNEEQKLAVEHRMDYPAVCLAGAGSGKTRVLTQRTVYLIAEKQVEPRKILCLTFTNKAANEMKERISVVSEDKSPRITTIHSLALSAIRRNPQGFGLSEKVTPIDDYDQKQILKKVIEEKKLEEIVKEWSVLEKIQFHRARGVGFRADYTAEIHAKAQVSHAGYHAMSDDELAVWGGYESLKTKMSVVDFDDMLHLVVRRGRSDEKWRLTIQKMFHHVLMDESQDTSVVQWDFVNLLLGPDNKNLFVVGDISQSIYSFNGASPDLLYQYTKEWRGVTPAMYKLEKNHRSVPEIVKLANKTQRCMIDVVPLQMKSYRGEQGESGAIILRKAGTPRELALKIADEIWNSNQLVKGRVKYGETAILVRAGSQVRDIETELVRYRIPYIIRGTMGLMQTEEVRDLLSYMRIISNPRDYFAMLRSIGVPKRGVGDGTLEKIRTIANENHDGDMIKAAKVYGHAKFSMYLSLLDELTALKEDPIKVLEHTIKATGYLNYLKERYKKDADKVEQKVNNIARLKDVILSLMAGADLTTDDLVFQLTMQDQKDDPNTKDGKVIVSTIHSAKGLEWKTVYVANVVEGVLPHKWSKTELEVEEERRVAYVAFTRAKDNLILCVPSMLEYFNKGNVFVAPSRFLVELGICK